MHVFLTYGAYAAGDHHWLMITPDNIWVSLRGVFKSSEVAVNSRATKLVIEARRAYRTL